MITTPSYSEKFELRHNAPKQHQIDHMLKIIKVKSIDELIDQVIPAGVRLKTPLHLPKVQSEFDFLRDFKKIISKNKIVKSYIGMGYYNAIMPTVILRNILENPNWYTPYTPYQAEISQGRLEALINFQTVITDLTGMDISNASLLDEATAAAESMCLLYTYQKKKKEVTTFLVDSNTFPQTISVLKTRALPLGIKLIIDDVEKWNLEQNEIFGLYLQNPNSHGAINIYSSLIEEAHKNDIATVMGVDIMSLLLLKSPGEMGADIAIGSSQRLGLPMGFGGPHAAFLATKEKYKRLIPGRIIGLSIDVHNNQCYRMALQTREQHIRREKATSNICTAQALLATLAGMYAVYHGSEGLRKIALRIHGLAKVLHCHLKSIGIKQINKHYFDTLKIAFSEQERLQTMALQRHMNFRYIDNQYIGISLDETTSLEDIQDIVDVFENISGKKSSVSIKNNLSISWPNTWIRTSSYMTHSTFHAYHSEHKMLRYIKALESKDISMAHSMISLGSCTMKLNATTEMIPITWTELSHIHPFAPPDQTTGYLELIKKLEKQLMEITQFTGISLQPNSGAQGEYTGLMVIRAYHKNNHEEHRNIALIPASAHGTNPASAVMAGLDVVVIASTQDGEIDIHDLKKQVEHHKKNICCLMVTYPSTHGVFEEGIVEICDLIHQYGGMVYMDGANMNAQIGLTSPSTIGADVCHLNLHKTFCIPHGGGGPGVGPICTNDKLKPFLPTHPIIKTGGEKAIQAVAAAPWGSANILAIPYAYIALMGSEGLVKSTKLAILNANYIKDRLAPHYKILYTGQTRRCAHELIIDCRQFKKINIEVEDIAKRLIDYGFHAPTVSFPVPGTLMIEPTESEDQEELDRFCDALIEIRNEVREIEEKKADQHNNVLKNAPHTASIVTGDVWNKPYSRHKATYPLAYLKKNKFWPPVGRIDNAYGDRHLKCTICL